MRACCLGKLSVMVPDHARSGERHNRLVVNRSLLLVHAHPDDESIGTGATMAKYAAEGARVTLVTCTLGELGEIIPPDLSHLLPDELGQHRIVELDRACRALGVEDHRFLGGEGKYRDSGMMGLPDNDDPRCFWQAPVEEAAADLVKVIEEVAPDVIVTYDANGFYGHPDHIQAHQVARRAHELTGRAAKFYATAMPRSVLAAAVELPDDSWFVRNPDLSVSVPDEQVTTEIDATPYLPAKLAAMKAHETQITVDGQFYALSDEVGRRALGTEYYTLLRARPARPALARPGSRTPRPFHAVSPGSWGPRALADYRPGLPGALRARPGAGSDRQLPVQPEPRAADRDRPHPDPVRDLRAGRVGAAHLRGRHPAGPRLGHRLVHPRDAEAERQRDHRGQLGRRVVPLRRRAGGGGRRRGVVLHLDPDQVPAR